MDETEPVGVTFLPAPGLPALRSPQQLGLPGHGVGPPDGVGEDGPGVGTRPGAHSLQLPVALVTRTLAVVEGVSVVPGAHHQVETGTVLGDNRDNPQLRSDRQRSSPGRRI